MALIPNGIPEKTIGGIKVYQKFSSGDPDTAKTAASWFGACIFLVIAGVVLESFFLR